MNLDEARSAFRRELGLPERGRIVMTGHQCSLWHAGILAKYIRCDRLASEPGASAAWLWVDQDTDETHSVRVPVRESGQLKAKTWALKPPTPGDVATASMPSFVPATFSGTPALPSVADGIARTISALITHRSRPNAARQFAAALTDLMAPLVRTGFGVFATSFMRTSLGRELIERMTADPAACVRAYNDAAAAHPGAGMMPLRIAGMDGRADVELPVWKLRFGTPRERVSASNLVSIDPAELAPRALLMTGMARLGACDLFIHGTGGGVYDAITERWFSSWLGVTLAPTIVVTADLTLPLSSTVVTPRDAARAAWKAHRARHDPSLLGDTDADASKRALVAAIRERRDRGEDASVHYRRMHALLKEYRERHADELSALRTAADGARDALGESALANDRTWPFVFHEWSALRSMRERVEIA